MTEADYARGRLPGRTYISRTFRLRNTRSRDFGQLARFVSKVFDEPEEMEPDSGTLERTEDVIMETRGRRKQIRFQVSREAGKVREIKIQRVPSDESVGRLENLLELDRTASERFINLIRGIEHIPVDGSAERVRVDDDLLRDVFSDPDTVKALYRRDPEQIRKLIADDSTASDIIAVAHRKKVIEQFKELLSDDEAFDRESRRVGGDERVWQQFLEANPWILGVTLAGQFLTSWDKKRLEQFVAGFSVAGPGKRTDALLRTHGAIRSLVLAEIKHHRSPLLGPEYRPGVWGASKELSGGISQIQQTVHLARTTIGDRLHDLDEGGAETGEVTRLVRPRSYLIIGDLRQLIADAGGVHVDKHRSFELHRRNLYEPEIITFDELLARAEWHVLG